MERIYESNEQFELILIRCIMFCPTLVGISWLRPLQFGIDGGELLTQKECLLLFGQRLVGGGNNIELTESCFTRTFVTFRISNEGESVERKTTEDVSSLLRSWERMRGG